MAKESSFGIELLLGANIPGMDQKRMDLELKRMQMALAALGKPCGKIPAIQIVGTNGKGSIASFIESTLKAAGIKAGVTTSPHLVSWCERIRISEQSITDQEFQRLLITLKPLAIKLELTPFEIVIATAFKYFSTQNVELLVLEVGLGGRLDATTAHPLRPIIAMASIGLDHCEHLGNDIKAIAKEKSAVISPGSKVISAIQHPEVTTIIEETAERNHAEIEWVEPLSNEWNLGIQGDVQRKNAAVAKGALNALTMLGWEISEKELRTGFALANWPGRLQEANWKGLPLLLDGAHNPHAAEQLAVERNNWERQDIGVHWVLGIQSHKQAPSMLRYLLKPTDKAWIVPIPNHTSWTKAELSKACPELAEQLCQAYEVNQILSRLELEEQWPNPAPVIAGSLYLIGDLLSKEIVKASEKEIPFQF